MPRVETKGTRKFLGMLLRLSLEKEKKKTKPNHHSHSPPLLLTPPIPGSAKGLFIQVMPTAPTHYQWRLWLLRRPGQRAWGQVSRENKCWSCCPQQLSGLSLCGTQLNMARCLCWEKMGKDRPGTGHSKSITQCHKANRKRAKPTLAGLEYDPASADSRPESHRV